MRTLKSLGIAALLAGAAFAQPTSFTVTQPDCQIFFHFTAAGQTSPTAPNAGLDNRTLGCTTWNISVASSGFTAFNVALQSAPNSAGTPGTYVTFANQSLLTGANPIIGAAPGGAGFGWLYGYNPWIQVKLVSATGTGIIDGAAYGWRIPSASSTTPGSVAADVNVAKFGGTAVTIGQQAAASSLPIVQAPTCTQTALASTTSSGLTEIVPLSAGKKVRICAAYVNVVQPGASPGDFGLATGTGTACATGTANLTQQWQGTAGAIQGFTQQTPDGVIFEGPSGAAVCLKMSAAPTSAKAQVLYDYY